MQISTIRENGALIFDIDQTLLPPDESLDRYPEIRAAIVRLLRGGLCLAFISGGPGAVAKNRVLEPLFREAGPEADCFRRLSFYVNGGGSKFTVSYDGILTEDKIYAAKNQIPGEAVHAVKKVLEEMIRRRFGLSDALFTQVWAGWKKKREEQWKGRAISFNDGWSEGRPWEIEFLEDSKMADIKAGKCGGKTSFPFINTRLMAARGEKIESVAGFTPTGFYELSKSRGDALDLDLRAQVIHELQKGFSAEELIFRKAGRSSIDITRKGTDKAACLKDLIRSENLNPARIFYFGDEFFPGGNDEPVALDPELQKSGLKIHAVKACSETHAFLLKIKL